MCRAARPNVFCNAHEDDAADGRHVHIAHKCAASTTTALAAYSLLREARASPPPLLKQTSLL